MRVLGLSAFYHDSAAALVEDDKIIAAAQEERFTRKRHDAGFPLEAIKYCLAEAGCTTREIMAVLGHDTLSEVERYTRDAEQVRLARSAMNKLTRDRSVNETSQTEAGKFGNVAVKQGKSS